MWQYITLSTNIFAFFVPSSVTQGLANAPASRVAAITCKGKTSPYSSEHRARPPPCMASMLHLAASLAGPDTRAGQADRQGRQVR